MNLLHLDGFRSVFHVKLIVSDLKIHVDILSYTTATNFSTLDSFGLVQHVLGPTYNSDSGEILHIFDLEISRKNYKQQSDFFKT